MRNQSFLRKVGLLLGLLLLPTLAWPFGFTPSPTDQSVVFLGFIFGIVNGVLHGTGSQIMGQMFAAFNAGVLALSGVLVVYTTLMGILNTAHDGELLGKKYSSVFVPLRTVLGILLIAPTSTGYSWIQVIVMWVVLQGVGTANNVWNAALSYLNNGGTIIVQNQDLNNGNSIRPAINNLVSSVTCLKNLQNAINETVSNSNSSNALPVPPPTEDTLQTVMDQLNPKQTANPVPTVSMPNFSSTTDPTWAPLNGLCGTISNITDSRTALDSSTLTSSYPAQYAIIGVRQVLMDLNSAVDTFASPCAAGCYPAGASPSSTPGACSAGIYIPPATSECSDDNNCTLFGFASSSTDPYASESSGQGISLNPTQNPLLSWCPSTTTNATSYGLPPQTVHVQNLGANTPQTVNEAVSDFIGLTYNNDGGDTQFSNAQTQKSLEDMQTDGWFFAGSYYFQLVAYNQGAQNGGSNASFTASGISNFSSSTINNAIPSGILSTYKSVFAKWLLPFFDTNQNNGLIGAFITSQLNPNLDNTGHKTAFATTPGGSNTSGIVYDILQIVLPGPIRMLISFGELLADQNNNANPVFLMMQFGEGMMDTALSTIFGSAAIMMALAAAASAIPCMDLGALPNAVITFITPFVYAITIPMMTTGAMLLYYLPAVPFMIFSFGVIGWLIGVIESMVAAPIVGFALMHPEGGGSDVFGKAEPALMLMLNLFLRPPLMIFGLIVGIMISYVGVWIINDGFSGVLLGIASAAGIDIGAFIVGIVAIPMIYMVIVMQVINRSFTLIYVLPDKVTRWISGGMQESLGSDMAGAEKDAKAGAQAGMGHISESAKSKAEWKDKKGVKGG